MKMRPTLYYASALFAAAALAQTPAPEIELYFSPNGGAAAAVVKELDAAKTSIHVLAYSISEDRITRALTRANTRGVAVILVVDPGQQSGKYSTAPKIKHAGVTTLVDRAHALMHNKTIIIDTAIVVTGSMNLTASGDKQNAENTIILRNAAAAAIYEDDFQKHLKHSTAFQPPPATSIPKPPPT
jgi:phosphatidylserine/phosphatidylglycerophosphate/cardiolipin synthase-like enzyme